MQTSLAKEGALNQALMRKSIHLGFHSDTAVLLCPKCFIRSKQGFGFKFCGAKLSFRKKFMAKHCLEPWLNSDAPDLMCHVLIGKAFTYLNRNSVSYNVFISVCSEASLAQDICFNYISVQNTSSVRIFILQDLE